MTYVVTHVREPSEYTSRIVRLPRALAVIETGRDEFHVEDAQGHVLARCWDRGVAEAIRTVLQTEAI